MFGDTREIEVSNSGALQEGGAVPAALHFTCAANQADGSNLNSDALISATVCKISSSNSLM